jgi:hypothetical protein|tara:strand:+ start:1957 stop:2178 length:222 start_codon:yes stop_codon:yes gene_type:complete
MNDPFGGNNPFEGWGAPSQPPQDIYPEPPPEKPSTKELTNKLLDALVIALDKGNKEEIEAIKNELELFLKFNK